MRLAHAQPRTILTPTGGFLAGFTHTLNPYRGCSLGGAACGVYCYASETRYGLDRAERWGGYLVAKEGAAALYRAEAARARAGGRPLKIFMSSVTDPWLPQERTLGVTRSLLEAMLDEPPDLLVAQTHTPGPLADLERLRALASRTRVVVQITVETDLERVPGLPPHAASIASRLEALAALTAAGLPTVAVASPLLPLGDERAFARQLGAAARGVILDHFLLGDGSPGGARTRRRRAHAELTLPEALEAAGLGEWATLARFEQVVATFHALLGAARVGVSQDGFRRAAVEEWPR
jgi:DNA repair photolyase